MNKCIDRETWSQASLEYLEMVKENDPTTLCAVPFKRRAMTPQITEEERKAIREKVKRNRKEGRRPKKKTPNGNKSGSAEITTTTATVLSKDAVERIVADVRRKFTLAPKLKFVVHASESKLPQET